MAWIYLGFTVTRGDIVMSGSILKTRLPVVKSLFYVISQDELKNSAKISVCKHVSHRQRSRFLYLGFSTPFLAKVDHKLFALFVFTKGSAKTKSVSRFANPKGFVFELSIPAPTPINNIQSELVVSYIYGMKQIKCTSKRQKGGKNCNSQKSTIPSHVDLLGELARIHLLHDHSQWASKQFPEYLSGIIMFPYLDW